MRAVALIVAGGEGTRMGSSLPKQFLPIQNRPLLMITLEAFNHCQAQPEIFLVMHKDHLDRWTSYCEEWEFRIPHSLVSGGKTRSESVFLGLKAMELKYKKNPFPEWIAVHDAVRPLIRPEEIDAGFNFARKMGNSIPCIPLKDSLRKINQDGSESISREDFRLVQTPQIFPGYELFQAYQQNQDLYFTDDASLFESQGKKIYLSKGDEENFKITYPLDLIIAEYILGKRL